MTRNGLIGFVEFTLRGSIPVYESDPLAVDTPGMTSAELHENYALDALGYDLEDESEWEWLPA